MSKVKELIVHKDIFGRAIQPDDVVIISAAGGFQRRLRVGVVKKLNPKMINVLPIGSRKIDRRYSDELLVVTDDPRVSAYLLINATAQTSKRR